jgi:hypothetical protein|tara:strand:- start:17327 stop:17923 length:597 start_codon:yes stop_codon:yes gene_type:complete
MNRYDGLLSNGYCIFDLNSDEAIHLEAIMNINQFNEEMWSELRWDNWGIKFLNNEEAISFTKSVKVSQTPSQCFFQNHISDDVKEADGLNKVIKSWLKEAYGLTIQQNPGLTLQIHKKGWGIKSHKDGNNGDRTCAILIYPNKGWEEKFGGNLILNDSEKIIPTFGKVVILDMTKNNVRHEVDIVTTDLPRMSLVAFI